MNSEFFARYTAESGDVLDAILTNSRDCIMLLTTAGVIEYASTSAVGVLGLGAIEEATGKAWPSFWPKNQQTALYEAVASAASGETVRYEGVIPSADSEDRHWRVTLAPVRGADQTVTHLLKVSTDITADVEAAEAIRQEKASAEEKIQHAGVVVRELRHRLKNQLAVIGAVAKLLARHTDGAKDLARKLEDKLVALANAQDLLTVLRDEPIGLGAAVAQVIRASGAGERVEIGDMPDISIPDESVQQLALILGELQTNALKHGALRDEGGRVRLDGETDGNTVTLRWYEECARTVAPTDSGGGGFQLIQRLGSAGGRRPEINWHARGIAVTFHIRAFK